MYADKQIFVCLLSISPSRIGGSFFIVEADVYGDVAAIVAETAAEEGQAAAAAAAGDIQPVGEGFTGAVIR